MSPPPNRDAAGGAEDDAAAVSLPEHASAYYSPRPPPAVTSHETLELLPVKLDPAVDPRFSDTHRVSVDGLQPPPWLAREGPSLATDDTVLVPSVRARRTRFRASTAALAAIFGATLGGWFGLRHMENSGGDGGVLSQVPRTVPGTKMESPRSAAPMVTRPGVVSTPVDTLGTLRPGASTGPGVAESTTARPPPATSAPTPPRTLRVSRQKAWLR